MGAINAIGQELFTPIPAHPDGLYPAFNTRVELENWLLESSIMKAWLTLQAFAASIHPDASLYFDLVEGLLIPGLKDGRVGTEKLADEAVTYAKLELEIQGDLQSILFKAGINDPRFSYLFSGTGQNSRVFYPAASSFATGAYSQALGRESIASGAHSVATGFCTRAETNSSTATGSTTACKADPAYGPDSTRGQHSGGVADGLRLGVPVLAQGYAAFNHSNNSNSQVEGHGALAPRSAILGGIDANIPVACEGVVLTASNSSKVPVNTKADGTGEAITYTHVAPQFLMQKAGGAIWLQSENGTFVPLRANNDGTVNLVAGVGSVDPNPGAGGGSGPINYTSPVTHSSGVNLTSADFGKHHVFTGTGVANWTVLLPDPAGNTGKLISLCIADEASGMWAMQTPAGDINGAAERRMHHGETALLQCTGTGYRKLSGRTIPLTARRQDDGSGNYAIAALTYHQLPSVIGDTSPGGLMTSLYASSVTAPRAGQYMVLSGQACMFPTPNPEYDLLVARNGNYGALGTQVDVQACYQTSGGILLKNQVAATVQMAANEYYMQLTYSVAPGTVENRAANPSYISYLELVEIPSW